MEFNIASMKTESRSPHHSANTFWTACNGCNTLFLYLKSCHNQTLLCLNCMKPFTALEIPHSSKPVQTPLETRDLLMRKAQKKIIIYKFSSTNNQSSGSRDQSSPETRKLLMLKARKEIQDKFSGNYNQSSTRDLTPLETRKLLILKARKEILKKVRDSGL